MTAFPPMSGMYSVDVRVRFGESASEALSELGYKGACNDHSPRDFVVPVSTLGDIEFGHGGLRFVYIELLTPERDLPIVSVQGVFVYRDLPYLGSFCCNDELINKIYDTAAYTCRLNIQHHIWGGIKRDRLVWSGDMHPEMKTMETDV